MYLHASNFSQLYSATPNGTDMDYHDFNSTTAVARNPLWAGKSSKLLGEPDDDDRASSPTPLLSMESSDV